MYRTKIVFFPNKCAKVITSRYNSSLKTLFYVFVKNRYIEPFYLISKNSYAASRRDLFRTKPYSSKPGRNVQNKDLAKTDNSLPQKCDPETIWRNGGHFNPGAETGSCHSQYYRYPKTLKNKNNVYNFFIPYTAYYLL